MYGDIKPFFKKDSQTDKKNDRPVIILSIKSKLYLYRVKLNDTYSLRSEIIFRVLQGSILGLLLLNIFLWDLFQFSQSKYCQLRKW